MAIGEVAAGHLIWGVIAPSRGVLQGAGNYAGVGGVGTVCAGLGGNIPGGSSGRSFSLRPVSVEDQTGLNIAGGFNTATLTPAAQ